MDIKEFATSAMDPSWVEPGWQKESNALARLKSIICSELNFNTLLVF